MIFHKSGGQSLLYSFSLNNCWTNSEGFSRAGFKKNRIFWTKLMEKWSDDNLQLCLFYFSSIIYIKYVIWYLFNSDLVKKYKYSFKFETSKQWKNSKKYYHQLKYLMTTAESTQTLRGSETLFWILQCIFFYTEEIKWKAKFYISNHAVKMIIKRIWIRREKNQTKTKTVTTFPTAFRQ